MFEYAMLILTTIMWSFVGILVKTSTFMASSWLISFCRFFFGVIFLFILILVTKQKISLNLSEKWIWIGIVGKSMNYFCENLALSHGFAYGNIITWPAQTLFFVVVSLFILKEKMTIYKLIATILCIAGIVLTSYNPKILDVIDSGSAILMTFLFIIAGVSAGVFLFAQKMLIDKMSAANMNFSIFLMASAVTAAPLPFNNNIIGDISFWPVFSLVMLGLITGIGFFLNAKVLKKVPLLVVVLTSNSAVLLVVLWSILIFHEPITFTVVLGCIVFLIGVLFVYLPDTKGVPVRK